MRTMGDLNPQELQRLFGDDVCLEVGEGYCLAKFEDGPPIGVVATMPVYDNGDLIDPAVDLTTDEELKVRTDLKLPATVHALELFAGTYHEGVFWLAEPGERATHALVSLYFDTCVQDREGIRGAIAAFLGTFRPAASRYASARGCLAQSQHIIKVPLSMWNLIYVSKRCSPQDWVEKIKLALGALKRLLLAS